MIAAGLVAQKAAEKGLTRKPWVKTSLAPGSRVVTDYLAKADLQRSLDEVGFDLVGYGCTTCIGNSGPAAGRDRRGGHRRQARGRGGALGQPQLRGPRPRPGQGQLPGLAAAGGGLCAGRLDAHRHHHRAAGHRQGRQAGLPEGRLADAAGGRRHGAQGRHRRGLQELLCRRVRRRRALGRDRCRQCRHDLQLGRQQHLHPAAALLRRHEARSRRPRCPTSRVPASWRCSAIRSPPTTSARPAASPRPARPRST